MAKKRKKYTVEELWNPQIDLSYDAAAYGRQSTKDQVITNIQSHISQTVGLLQNAKEIGFKDDGSTGIVTLFVENEVVDEDGNTTVKNASGTWPIDKRPGLKAILDLIESGKVKLVIVEFVDRLFRDEDRIDSNVFIKTCKEHDCFVYITSKKMIYNFANPQIAEMFRMEVAFAAAYIEHHIKGTMIGRRDMAVRNGQFGGGYVPMGFVVCKQKGEKYNKFLPYTPHAEVINEAGRKILPLGIAEFCRQAQKEPVFFPDFELGVHIGARRATKVERGYIIKSRKGLIELVTNPANIGNIEFGDIYVEGAHDPTMDRDLYNLLVSKLKGNKMNEGRRYYQKDSTVERVGTLKKLLTSSDNRACRYAHNRVEYYYQLYHNGLVQESYCIDADSIESLIENRLLERIKEYDLGSFVEELKARIAKKAKRIKDIDIRLLVIDEEITRLADDLNKTSIQIMIDKINVQAKKLEQEVKDLNEEKKTIGKKLKEPDMSIEAELSRLDIMEKPVSLRQAILEFLIRRVVFDRMSTRFFRAQIEWKVPEWGTDEIYIDKEGATCVHWTEEELTVLSNLYPTASHENILEALPNRSWGSIKIMAHNHQLRRAKKGKNIPSKNMSWRDTQFLNNNRVTIGNWNQTSGQTSSYIILIHKRKRN